MGVYVVGSCPINYNLFLPLPRVVLHKTGAQGSLVGRAQRLHQTAVYQWVSAGGDLPLQGQDRTGLCILGWQVPTLGRWFTCVSSTGFLHH